MISLTRLSGSVFVLNADLIERLDHTPDTVITLVDGKKYVVAESMEQVVDLIQCYRGQVIAVSELRGTAPGPGHRPVHLTSVAPPSSRAEEAD